MLGDREITAQPNRLGSEISSGVRTYRVVSVGQPDKQDRMVVQVVIS
jgi:hypothetical protein